MRYHEIVVESPETDPERLALIQIMYGVGSTHSEVEEAELESDRAATELTAAKAKKANADADAAAADAISEPEANRGR